jgi:glyoxylase-like metal-dependent hydrolase (beta-lactamase superfamily II)
MNLKSILRFGALGLALCGIWIAYTQQAPEPLEIERVADDLHVIIGSGGTVAVLVSDEGVAIVDDKFDRNVPEILAKVKSVTDQPIRFVLNTHHHGDHTGGNAQLGKTAAIIAHENARANVVKNSQPGAPHVTFQDETRLYVGGKEVRALHFGRAHTNGDAIIYFPQQRVIHTGDMFVRGAPFIDYANGGSAKEWDATIGKVLELDFDTIIPGHGAVSKRADLVQWRKDYATFRERVREVSRQGKSPEEAAKLIKTDDLQGWNLGGLQMRSLPDLLKEMGN